LVVFQHFNVGAKTSMNTPLPPPSSDVVSRCTADGGIAARWRVSIWVCGHRDGAIGGLTCVLPRRPSLHPPLAVTRLSRFPPRAILPTHIPLPFYLSCGFPVALTPLFSWVICLSPFSTRELPTFASLLIFPFR